MTESASYRRAPQGTVTGARGAGGEAVAAPGPGVVRGGAASDPSESEAEEQRGGTCAHGQVTQHPDSTVRGPGGKPLASLSPLLSVCCHCAGCSWPNSAEAGSLGRW